MSKCFNLPVGLSDHTMITAIPAVAVAVGACAIEKHLTLARSDGGEDAAFSLEPHEFKEMVQAVRMTELAIGEVSYIPSKSEKNARVYRRSLFAVRNIKAGDLISIDMVRSIRPGHGLHPRYLTSILGKKAIKIEN